MDKGVKFECHTFDTFLSVKGKKQQELIPLLLKYGDTSDKLT
jgi:hypothetical protein